MSDVDDIETMVQKNSTHVYPRITKDRIESLISAEDYFNFENSTTIVCKITLRNGFDVIGYSSTVCDQNLDSDVGKMMARRRALQKAFLLEGYLLREKIHNGVPIEDLITEYCGDN